MVGSHHEELKDQEFKDELDDVVNTLRKDGPLKDFSSMQRFCLEHSRTRMSPQGGKEYYGLRVDTDKHRYYLRFCPMQGNYNFYISRRLQTQRIRSRIRWRVRWASGWWSPASRSTYTGR